MRASGPFGVVLSTLLLLPSCSGGEARSGEPQIPRIAILRSVPTDNPPTESPFRREMDRLGYVEGRNVEIVGDGMGESYPHPRTAEEKVREWRREGVEVIVALSTSAAQSARNAAPDAKILFLSNDPLAGGLVENEMRPEGRLTGVTFRVPEDRTLMLAARIVPGLRRIGLAYPPFDPAAVPSRDNFTTAARDLGLELITEEFAGEGDIGLAVDRLAGRGVQLLLLSISPTATLAAPTFLEAADRVGVPVVASIDEVAGRALLTLVPDTDFLQRQLARQTVRLLQGATPGSIPVESPRRFRLTVNEAVASRHGLSIPEAVIREADAVLR